MVNKLASGLTKLDFGKGDVICMFCSNYVDYWLIVLAAWCVGVIAKMEGDGESIKPTLQ